MSISTLLPCLKTIAVDSVTTLAEIILIRMATVADTVACPVCSQSSQRLHSHYERMLTDLPWNRVTVHTYGRDLHFHVHVHVLCTAGGLRADKVWQPIKLYPAQQYRRLWQYYLLKLLRKKLKGDRSTQWRIGRLFTVYPTGFLVNVMSKYRNGKQAAAYCCRYTGRPRLGKADRGL